MVDTLMNLLARQDPAAIADLFLVLIVLLFLVALYATTVRRHQPFIQFAPTLLTSMGILGTFTGISIGLANFDYSDQVSIDKSIPLLLGGLKMAFLTSIAGMSASLIAKLWATWRSNESREAEEPADAESILRALHDLRGAITGEGDTTVVTQLQKLRTDIQDGLRDTRRALGPEGGKSVSDRLETLAQETRGFGTSIHDQAKRIVTEQEEARKLAQAALETHERTARSIAGEGDSSVVTQLQRARTDLQEGLQAIRDDMHGSHQANQGVLAEIRGDLREFADKVSELGSKALIEALSEVIRDFNQKLTEQFGDNFKRLDESVGKLLEWQDNYRVQMADMKAGLQQAIDAVQSSKEALAGVQAHATAIPELMSRIEVIIRAADAQLQDLERHLLAFAQIRDRAVEAVPEIRKTLDRSFEEMEGAVAAASNHYRGLLDGAREYIDKFTEDTRAFQQLFTQETDKWLDLVSTTLKDGSGQIARATQVASEVLQSMSSQVADSAKGVREQLEVAITELKRSTDEKILAVGNAMNAAVSRLQENVTRVFNEQAASVQLLNRELREGNQKAAQDRTQILNDEITAIHARIEEELNRILQQMANALVQVTNKFVQDYTHLTTAMGAVVSQARNVAGDQPRPFP